MSQQRGLIALIDLLNILRRIDPEFPIQYALCLAEISRQQGISVTELSSRTGITLSTVSRIIGALSGNRRRCGGLVRVRFSPQEGRRKELFLTPRGAALIAHLAVEIERNAGPRPHPRKSA